MLLLLLLLRLLCVSLGFSTLVVGYVVDCEVEFCCGAGEHGADCGGLIGDGKGGLDYIGLVDGWGRWEVGWGEYGRIGGM